MGTPAGVLIIATRASSLATQTAGWSQSWGVCDGTHSRVCYSASRDSAATGVSKSAGHNASLIRIIDPATNTVVVEGVFSAWSADGVTVNYTTADSTAWQVTVILLGGSQCQCFVTDATPPATTGATTVTAAYQADFVLAAIARSQDGTQANVADFSFGFATRNAGSPQNFCVQNVCDRGTTSSSRTRISNADMGALITLLVPGDTLTDAAVISNFTSTGFNISNSAAGAAGQGPNLSMMAVKVTGSVAVGVSGHEDTMPIAAGNVGYAFPGFKSGTLFGFISNNTSANSDLGNGTGGMSVSDLRGLVAGCSIVTGLTNTSPSRTRSNHSHAFCDFWNSNDSVHVAVAALVSQDTNGHTLNFTTAPSSAREFYQLVIQEMPTTVSPTGIASAQAMGSPTIVRGALSVAPTGIGSAQAMGSPTIVRGALLIHPTGIASAQAMGTPTIVRGALSVSPTGIASTQAFGVPTIVRGALTVSPTGIGSAQAFGVPTIVRGTLLVHPTGIGSSEAFGTPLIVEPITVAPVGIPSAQAFGMPTIILGTDTVVPVGITSTEAFGVPTIVRGTLLIHPNGIGSAEAFGTPTIVRGTLLVHPTGIASSEAFGNPVINNGGILVQVTSVPSAEAFGSPTIVLGTINVQIVGIASGEAFGSPTIFVVTPIVVQPIGIASAEAFGSPIITNVPPVIAMMLNKKRAYDAILSRVAGAVFVRVSYDQATSTLTVGDEVKPKSVLLNELSTTFAEAKRWRRSYKQQRDRWTWNLILMFDKEASTEIFERDMLDNPIHLPADRPNGLEAFTVKAIDANYVIPPQQQSSNGTRASYRVTVEFAPV